MNAQVDFLHNAKQGNTYSPLIAKAVDTNTFRHEQRIAIMNPLDIAVSDVSVRHLKTKSDIQEIQYLRGEINLELHRSIDPLFAEHEKKEMN